MFKQNKVRALRREHENTKKGKSKRVVLVADTERVIPNNISH